jgi:hypothetical protein
LAERKGFEPITISKLESGGRRPDVVDVRVALRIGELAD